MINLIDTIDADTIDRRVVIHRDKFLEGIAEARKTMLIYGNVDIEYVGFSVEELNYLRLNFEKFEKEVGRRQ